jgi:hypothetical protein
MLPSTKHNSELDQPAVLSTATEVLNIIPRLPTRFCGVGDHAMAIGRELTETHGCNVSYLGVSPNSNVIVDDGYRILPKRSGAALLTALSEANLKRGAFLVLHFSGYSYGSRGLCFWLPRAIERFKNERPDIRLVTMFHELWAPAPLLSRSGWVVPLQKAIVRKLVSQSDVVRTNRAEYARQLEQLCVAIVGKVRVRNICSNFGEPLVLASIPKRSRQIVIFQPPDTTTLAGKRFWDGWERLATQLQWPKTIVAGRTKTIPSHPSIELRGFVSAKDGSELMRESQFVYLDYYNGYLGKSSFFGSLAAHGIVPVMPDRNESEADGLYHGQHYLIAGDSAVLDADSIQAVADQLSRWYSYNSIPATASDYASDMSHQSAKDSVRHAGTRHAD